jgi:hypothetical protein
MRTITFVRSGDPLDGVHAAVCGFLPMQGASGPVPSAGRLSWAAGRCACPPAAGERTGMWASVTARDQEWFEGLTLWPDTADACTAAIWQEPGTDPRN